MLDRREVIGFMGLGVTGLAMMSGCRDNKATTQPDTSSPNNSHDNPSLTASITALEQREGGRLGVGFLDTGTGAGFAYRGDERFAMCSTFKMPLSALVLKNADISRLKLDEMLPVRQEDIIANSPVTEKHVGQAMTISDLCHATMTTSDNAAANLLLARVGGPSAFTAFMGLLGDNVTRLDRTEPMMSESKPGDVRDTTSPKAMLGSMNTLLLGDALSPSSREMLTGWMVANTTGNAAIRAGTPKDWRVGDKTGAGDYGTRNDIAILWPPEKKPILLTLYYTETDKDMDARSAVLAEATRLVLTAI